MQNDDKRACPGCCVSPKDGFSKFSKSPNKDGFVHWCSASRRIAAQQEVEKQRKIMEQKNL